MMSAVSPVVTVAAHTAHVLLVVIGAVVVGGLLLVSRPRRRPTMTKRRHQRASAAAVVAVASTAAAVVHAAVAPAHFGERVLFGLFFLAASLLQLVWGVIALRAPGRTLWTVGAAGNTAVVVLWLVTRAYGLPFGLLPQPERVGAWDVVATGCELVVVTGCLVLLMKERSCGGRSGWSATPSLPSHIC